MSFVPCGGRGKCHVEVTFLCLLQFSVFRTFVNIISSDFTQPGRVVVSSFTNVENGAQRGRGICSWSQSRARTGSQLFCFPLQGSLGLLLSDNWSIGIWWDFNVNEALFGPRVNNHNSARHILQVAYSSDECLCVSVWGTPLGQAETQFLPLGAYSLRESQCHHSAPLLGAESAVWTWFPFSLGLSKQTPGNPNPSQSLKRVMRCSPPATTSPPFFPLFAHCDQGPVASLPVLVRQRREEAVWPDVGTQSIPTSSQMSETLI